MTAKEALEISQSIKKWEDLKIDPWMEIIYNEIKIAAGIGCTDVSIVFSSLRSNSSPQKRMHLEQEYMVEEELRKQGFNVVVFTLPDGFGITRGPRKISWDNKKLLD